jgi:serine/threonine protein kinase
MSPEQCGMGQHIDRRSDLFSLGIVLWELLTLQGLYRRGTVLDTMRAIGTETPLPPSGFRKDTPPELDDLTMTLLAKRPDDRFQTAGALLGAIESTAMKLRCPLSSASLSRELQQWFGERVEPWVENTSSGSGKKLVVATASMVVPSVKTLSPGAEQVSPAVEQELQTLKPSTTPRPDLPLDTIPDGPPGESIEALRDRLFKEAKARKTPRPEVPDPEDGRATLPRMRLDESVRYKPAQPQVVQPFAPLGQLAPPAAPSSSRGQPGDARSFPPWMFAILAMVVIAIVAAIVFSVVV